MVPDFSGLAWALLVLAFLAIIGLTFGVWKIIEIILWIKNNVSIIVG